MAKTDVFALTQSAMNPFLFSDIGLDTRGSPVTVLSTLARLGEDPWAQALMWDKLPKPAVVGFLLSRMRQMPLSVQALNDADTTATRIVQRLPGQGGQTSAAPVPTVTATATSNTLPPQSTRMMIFYAIFAIGLVLNMIFGKAYQTPEPTMMNVGASQPVAKTPPVVAPPK